MLADKPHSTRYLRPTDRSCRQLLIVGAHARPSRLMRLGSFHVLLESNDGYLHWCAIRSRSFPDLKELSSLAGILSENVPSNRIQNTTLIEDRIGDEMGLAVQFLDGDPEDPAAWHFGDVVADLVLASIGSGTKINASDCLRDLENAWREKITAFLALLNQDVLTAARLLGGLSPKRYNFLVNTDPKVATYRRQAVMAMPLLMQELCDNSDPAMAPLLGAIDEGKPLFKLLATRYQVQPSVLRTLAGVRPDWLSKTRTNRIATIVRLISDIDVNFRPRNDEEWRKFSAALDTLGSLSKRSLNVASSKMWIRHIAQNGFALPKALAGNVEAHSQMIDQFVNALISAVVFELESRKAGHLQERAITDLNRHYLLPQRLDRLLEVCRRYGDALRQAQLSCTPEMQAMTSRNWPSPIAGSLQNDDLFIVPLLTPKELVDEGKAMSNCIEKYYAACTRGECQLFSIRDRNHRRLSCVETILHQTPTGRFDLRVVQHKAHGNTTPGYEALRAVETLVKHVGTGGPDIEEYWTWKTRVAVLNMGQRRAKARMLPVLCALRAVMPTRYGLDRLVESVIGGEFQYGE